GCSLTAARCYEVLMLTTYRSIVLRYCFAVFVLGFTGHAMAAELTSLALERISKVFPQHDAITEPAGDPPVRRITVNEDLLGYAFETNDVVDIPAYSGKPVNVQVVLDVEGIIQDAYVLEHHEPILLVGIPEQKLHDFAARFTGL